MASSTFGATAKALEDLYFPGRITESTEAGPEQAEKKIDEIAGDVAVELRQAKIRPEDITEEGSPNAWKWLTRTILLGAAAQYGRVAATHSVDVFDDWDRKFEARMERLRADPKSVLDDVPTYGGGTSAYNAFV